MEDYKRHPPEPVSSSVLSITFAKIIGAPDLSQVSKRVCKSIDIKSSLTLVWWSVEEVKGKGYLQEKYSFGRPHQYAQIVT